MKYLEVENMLITGANKGIGLELVRQIVRLPQFPRFIFATYRDETTTEDLKWIRESSDTEIVLIKMDVTKKEDIERGRKIMEEKLGERGGLNLLINNAGYMNRQSLFEVTEENLLSHFKTNTIGPIMLFKEMLPLLQKGARNKEGMHVSRAAVLNITSGGGSIKQVTGEMPEIISDILSYRASKAALNMAMRVAALTSVKNQGILIINMCPGWVKTDIGSEAALLTTMHSVSDILETLPKLNESHHGLLIDRNGIFLPY